MKFTILVVFFAVLVISSAKKHCKSADDCEADECCRFLGFLRESECTPLSKDGEHCSEEDQILFHRYYHCPCAKGLTCEPKEVKSIFGVTIKLDERCTTGDATTSFPETEPPAEE